MHKPKPEMSSLDTFYEKYVPDPPPLDWERAEHIVYEGIRRDGEELDTSTGVLVDGVPDVLPWRLDLYNHSPTGLEWGYGGSGPHQLALAILAHATGDEAYSKAQHWLFARQYTCVFARLGFEISGTRVLQWATTNPIDKRRRFEFLPPRIQSEMLDRSMVEEFLSECCEADLTYTGVIRGETRRSFATCTECNRQFEF